MVVLQKETKEEYIAELNAKSPGLNFDGPLTEIQSSEVEDRSYEKMTKKINRRVDDAIAKAQYLLKLQVPEIFKKAKQAEQMEII